MTYFIRADIHISASSIYWGSGFSQTCTPEQVQQLERWHMYVITSLPAINQSTLQREVCMHNTISMLPALVNRERNHQISHNWHLFCSMFRQQAS